MAVSLSSYERVRRTFAREDLDRLARYDTYWGNTLERWAREGLVGGANGALEMLGADMWRCGADGIYWPYPFPGRDELVAEDEETKTFTDAWGATIRHFKTKNTTPEHLGWECDSPEVWHERFRPLIAEQPIRIDIEGSRELLAEGRRRQVWTFFDGIEPIELLRKLLGDVVSLEGMIEEPEWIIDICEVMTDNSLRNYDAMWEAGVQPDMLWVYGDMAYNHATMCSPQTYRELVWPSHKRMCDWAHERGIPFVYHTDGNVNGVMDLYLEAGFDCLQPLEVKAGMDIRELLPKFGKEMVFFGNVDVMAMIDNDLERMEAEVQTKLEAGKAHGGYIYHSDHSIPPQVSWESYQALAGMVEKWGAF